jgi:hypothetical protein
VDIFIKIARRPYDRLRSHIPAESAAREAVERASRIEHSVEGVLFAGYSIPCNEKQARIILETAKQVCPEIIPDIQRAMIAAGSV